MAKDFTISSKYIPEFDAWSGGKLNFHWHMTGRVADLGAGHTSGLGGLSNWVFMV
jgi:hypothetical protein